MTVETLATIVFSPERHADFAALSADWNPLHMNPVVARRTQAGVPVVHGMHVVAGSLDALAARVPGLRLPTQIKATFSKPVYVGDAVSVTLVGASDTEFRVQARVEGMLTTSVRVAMSDTPHRDDAPASAKSAADSSTDTSLTPRELSLADMVDRSGAVGQRATADALAARFPHATQWMGAARVGALCGVSRLVGMECPGLHSMLAGVTLHPVPDTAGSALSYTVVGVDDRVRLITMDVDGCGIRGRVEAFARHPPVRQPSMAEVARRVTPGEFAGQRTLVVGGSRGLGELTAKVIAAGGGHPIITYTVGKEDAEAVVAEIERHGATCEVMPYDVRLPCVPQLRGLGAPMSYLYYFATSPIFRRSTRDFDPARFREFIDFYVHGFHGLCAALTAGPSPWLSVFYPSSTAVEERPPDMTEYAMAKAAAEQLCTDLARFSAGIRIVWFRLPRLSTDQTATTVPIETADALDVLLPLIRQVQRPRSSPSPPAPSRKSSVDPFPPRSDR